MTDTFKPFVAKVATGAPLSRDDARAAFDIIMSGQASPSQIGAFLMGLRVRGETVEEIAGAVSVMRDKMTPVQAPADAIDIVGTGGDGSGSYNVSTCAAFIVAGAGVPVAKHGNRAVSSKSGAADVLMALGVKVDIGPDKIAECIGEAGIGFMFAPNHHAAMRHVGPVRAELGIRTIFNLLGPLSNPANVRRYVLGVYDRAWVEPLAAALLALGATRALVVHGAGGLDEISTAGPTAMASVGNGQVDVFEMSPEDVGLTRVTTADLTGGDAPHNARALRAVLEGEASPYRDIAALNAAAGLLVADKAATMADALALAHQSIDSGAALARLDRLIAVSNG